MFFLEIMMEEMQRRNGISHVEQHSTSSRLHDAQNNIMNNITKQESSPVERKRTRKKKYAAAAAAAAVSRENSAAIDTKETNTPNAEERAALDNGTDNDASVLTKINAPADASAMRSKNHVSKDASQNVAAAQAATAKKRQRTKSELDKGRNSIKENVQTDVTTSDKPVPVIDEKDCNEPVSAFKAIADSSSNAKANHKASTNQVKKSTRAKCTYSRINYEFHEANHAIIDTFSVSVDLFIRANNRTNYCLVCDMSIRMQDNDIQKQLCRHIRSKKHMHLLSLLIEDEKRSISNGKHFSELALAREYMISNEDVVECTLCSSKSLCCRIKNDEESVREHIADNAHRDAKLSWELPVKNALEYIHNQFQSRYNAKVYCCRFCNYQSPSEFYFIKHLHVPYHVARLMEIPDYTNKFKFYLCSICKVLWFGSVDTSDHHYEQIEHKRTLMYGPDVNVLSEKVTEFLVHCGQNAEDLLQHSNRVCYDEAKKHHILYSFETDLRKYIPSVKAYPFGSRISDLGFPDSDIDVFLDCNNTYEGNNLSYSQSQSLLATVVNYLSHNRKLWIVHDVILHSRTPIAKVVHVPSKIMCDISVTSGLAVENTKMIKCFNRAFPPCRKLILFLKRWLHLTGLLGSHLVTSYALTWCVIFYLQTLLVFPSISDLIKLKNKSWLISGWEVGVSYDFCVNKLDHTFEELLLGFFLFYADFKYKSQVICPLLGRPISKDAFVKLSDLPRDMTPYIVHIRANGIQEESLQAFSLSPLCVQDPFDLSHNLTKAINNKKLKTFWNHCSVSAKLLKTNLPNLNSPFMP